MVNITEHSDVSIACSWCDDLRSKVDHFPFFFLPNRLVDHSGNSDLRAHQPRRYDRLCYLQRRYDRPVTLRTRRFALWQHPCHQNVRQPTAIPRYLAGRLPLKAHLGSKTYRSRVSPHVTPSSSFPSACRWYPLVHHIRSSWLSLLVTVLTILHPIKPLYAFSRRILASERERGRGKEREEK